MLRKLYTRVEDATGSAVASPSVSVLRVGAEIVRDASAGTAVVGVRHPGALKQNDVCYVLRNGGILDGVTVTVSDPSWTYDSVNGDWTSEIAATGGYTITVGDRLVLTGNTSSHFVKAYDNDSRSGTAVTSAITAGADGVIQKYVDATDVDIKIVSGSQTKYVTDISTEGRQFVTPEEFGAVGDGTTDDTRAIQLALDFVNKSGGGDVRFGPNTYIVSGTDNGNTGVSALGVYSNTRLIGSGTKTVLKLSSNTSNRGILWNQESSGSNLVIENMTFDGNSAGNSLGSSSEDLVTIADFDDVIVSGVRFQDCLDSGLFLSRCSNVTVSKCTFNGCQDVGIYVNEPHSTKTASSVKITECHFEECDGGAVAIKRTSSRGVIGGCTVYNCGNGFTFEEGGGGGLSEDPGSRWTIENNQLTKIVDQGFATANRAIDVRLANETAIIGNRINECKVGIIVQGSKRCSISGNVVDDCNGSSGSNGCGIYLTSRTDGASVVQYSESNSIVGNTVNAPERYGIFDSDSNNKYNSILGNTVVSPTLNGIEAVGSYTVVSGNSVVGGSANGISVNSAASHTVVTSNVCTLNATAGISDGGDRTCIVANICRANATDQITASGTNTVNANNIIS